MRNRSLVAAGGTRWRMPRKHPCRDFGTQDEAKRIEGLVSEKFGTLSRYWEVFDSTEREEPVCGLLSDDSAEIYLAEIFFAYQSALIGVKFCSFSGIISLDILGGASRTIRNALEVSAFALSASASLSFSLSVVRFFFLKEPLRIRGIVLVLASAVVLLLAAALIEAHAQQAIKSIILSERGEWF
jgi:hypothetical protein